MSNARRRIVGVAIIGPIVAIGSSAAMAADVNINITSSGRDTVTTMPCGGTIGYVVSVGVPDSDNEGLAGFFFDVAFGGGPLEPADTPVAGPTLRFAPPDGISGPGGFGGTVVNGMLVNVGGAQNTIKNTADYAPFPIGEVLTGVAHTEVVLVTGSFATPVEPGTYTLTLSNLRATVIKQGEDGSGVVWGTEPAGVGTFSNLTVIVPRADPPASASNSGPVCTGDDVTLFGGPDGMTSYFWTGPGGFASTEQSPIISPAVHGTYTLTVTDDNSCIDRATTTVDVVPATCEPWTDCNSNGAHDDCDLSFHSSDDCNVNAIPDECESVVLFVDAGATRANNGQSWLDAYDDLQAALTNASANCVVREIWVAADTYTPDRGTGDREATFQLVNGVAIYGGFPLGGGDWNARDPYEYETTLSGDLGVIGDKADNSYHVVTGSGTDRTAVLDGFTITAGNANEYPHRQGGGISNADNGSPTLANCRIVANRAISDGGGMYNGDGCSPTLTACEFVENVAFSRGGGMYNSGGSPTVTDCVFSGNSGEGFGGGGGGLYNWGGAPRLANCAFVGNSAPAGAGGGIQSLYASPAIIRCLFSGNRAQASGGAVYVGHGNPTFINCVFTGNSSLGRDGGGMCNYFASPIVTNCVFSGNSADDYGGGIRNIEISSAPTLTNSILWDNTDASGVTETAQISGGTPTVNYNCVLGWTGVLGGIGNIGDDPLFVDSDGFDGIPGTQDDDLHLSADSPCINTGNNDAAIAFSDAITAGGTTTTIIVTDAGKYGVGDEIEYENDCVLRTVIAIDRETDTITFAPALEAPSQTGITIKNYGWGDIDGADRIMCGQVDMGAHEVVCRFGDVSRDSQISAYDAALAAQCAEDLLALSVIERFAADVNGSHCISSHDADLIAQYAALVISSFPVERKCGALNRVPVCACTGDFDDDGYVELDDFALFAECLAGPDESLPPAACTPELFIAADLDADGDVDHYDFSILQAAFTGP